MGGKVVGGFSSSSGWSGDTAAITTRGLVGDVE